MGTFIKLRDNLSLAEVVEAAKSTVGYAEGTHSIEKERDRPREIIVTIRGLISGECNTFRSIKTK